MTMTLNDNSRHRGHTRTISAVQTGLSFLLVDDHPIFRHGLAVLFSELWPDCTVSEAGSVDQAREVLSAQDGIDLVILDLKMPGVSGYDALTTLLEVVGDTPIMIVSSLGSSRNIRDALAAGAKGYVPKTLSAEIFKLAVSLIMAGETFVPSGALVADGSANEFDEWQQASGVVCPLTRRQTEVLRAIAQGMSNKEIARTLGMLEGTVKVHVREILRRLSANNRTHAVITGAKLGIVPPTDQL